MKLVIDISENMYNFVNTKRPNGYYNNFDEFDCYDISKCIRNGIVIPKEHGDLIDRKALLNRPYEKDGFIEWYDEIKHAPIIIEADKEK